MQPLPSLQFLRRARRDAGYRAVGLHQVEAWVEGKRPLPERAVLITFDDARLDSLTAADGILAEYGLRALQFVPTALVKGERGHYMSLADLKRLARSGRWEFGSHGHLAHMPVPVDAEGTPAHFLSSRRWIQEEGRLETPAELERRLAEDYRASRVKLEEALGLKEIAAYSFPFGDHGQLGLSNEKHAGPLNLRLAGERYRLLFSQLAGGYNLRDGDRLLARFPVPRDWDGPRLLAHLRENHPLARASLEGARILSWMGRLTESIEEAQAAADRGAAPREVLRARAKAALWKGNRLEAADAFRDLLDLDPADLDARESLEKAEEPSRPLASARLELWWDSDDRGIIRQLARGEGSPLPWLRLHGELGHESYVESGLHPIEAAVAQAGAAALFRGPLRLEAAAGEHWFDGARDAPHYAAAVRYGGLDLAAFELEAAGGPVGTPRAVLEGIHLDAQTAIASWKITPLARLLLSHRHGFYSDGNGRDTTRWEYGRRLVELIETPTVALGYTGSYDDTRRDDRAYYTPESLHVHRAFARVDARLGDRLHLTARIAGGYGWETGEGRPVGDGLVKLRYEITDRIEVSAGVGHLRNPRSWASEALVGVVVRF